MPRATRSSARSVNTITEDSSPSMKPGLKARKAATTMTAAASARKRPSSGAAASTIKASMQVVKPAPAEKKRKVEPNSPSSAPKRTASAPSAATATTFDHTGPSKYTPTLLPPTLSFALPDAISHLSAHDPRFGSMFTHIPIKPFQPPLEAIDPFKTLVTSIIGQQVSWMAARAINKRFQELFGYTEDSAGYPSPLEVAREDVMRLKGVGLSLRKAEYVICLAQHFVDGRLSTELLRDGTDEEIAKALIAVRGIGQWTVDMFLMFSLRRPDVLPVGDLGVQKGLLRWALAAHGCLPKSKSGKAADEARKKYGLGKKADVGVVVDKVDPSSGSGEIDTTIQGRATTPSRQTKGSILPPTPLTPTNGSESSSLSAPPPHLAALHTPGSSGTVQIPHTPVTPGPSTTTTTTSTPPAQDVKPAETLETSGQDLPPPAPETFLEPQPGNSDWNVERAAPLEGGLTVELMKSRLSGKKAKGGAYLTPAEMDVLTQGWKPYRSLGVYYMWPAGEEF